MSWYFVHHISGWLHFDNSLKKNENSISILDDEKEAIKIFKRGARFAKGTTTETGLVESYFANPFGPYQKQDTCDKLIETYFNKLYENNKKVGQIKTQLGVEGMETDGPLKSAKELFEIIKAL